MNDQDMTNALASALPGGIDYAGTGEYWRAEQIATYQAQRLREGGYVLVHPDLESAAHMGATLARHAPLLATRVLWQGDAVADANVSGS